MIFRDATLDDLSAITALYGREVTGGTATFELEPPTSAEMRIRFDGVRRHDLPWLVAEIDGVFAGYAYLSPFRPRPAYRFGVEASVYVEDAARGSGVGRALLTALTERARARGLRHVIGAISDSATRDASLRLHRSLGFREAGVYRQVGWKFDRWLDVTLMQLDLAPQGDAPQGRLNTNAVAEAPVARPAPQPQQSAAPQQQAQAPAQPPQRPAQAPAAAGGGATIQLGAFSTGASANSAWTALSGRFRYLAPLSRSVIPVQSGGRTLYRLRASGPGAADVCRRRPRASSPSRRGRP